MTSLLQNLSKVDERYVDIDRPLFARYVPGIRAAMEAGDLEQQIEEERRCEGASQTKIVVLNELE